VTGLGAIERRIEGLNLTGAVIKIKVVDYQQSVDGACGVPCLKEIG
jgi:hypothetical protein